jgi:hypothetical protein
MKSFKVRVLMCLLLATMSNLSFAWAGTVSGTVQMIDVAPGENYGFRVYIKDLPAMCGNSNNWAYINESDSNYKTYVSVILAAKMAGTPVVIFSEKETTSGNNYCHIGYISLR